MRRAALVGIIVASAVVVGTGGFVIGLRVIPGHDRAGGPGPTARSPSPAATRGLPWRDRPVVRLSYDVAADHESVTGVEKVRFRPDRTVCGSLVFRAWPNKPETAKNGGSLRVDKAEVDGRSVRKKVERAGAPPVAPGTLIRLPLRDCVRAGAAVDVRLSFTVVVAHDSGDRVDTNGTGEMWFASAYPVLAWERGHGWMTDPAVDVFGEMDGSEEFRLSLDVVAPRGDAVLGTGRAVDTGKGPRRGTTRHRFAADSVRNVAVSVGRYEVSTREVAGVRVRVGVSNDGSRATARVWMDKIGTEIGLLQRKFGRFPYRDLWVTVVPDTSGIEFPGAIFYGDQTADQVTDTDLVGHELAHMWFYALVGNDQGRDPWLDEALATYAEALVDGEESAYDPQENVPAAAKNKVGEPMTYWNHRQDDYSIGVYREGATMLFAARRRAGPKKWDAAMRAYIRRNAHRIARPADFVAAVDKLPHAVATLKRYGAVP